MVVGGLGLDPVRRGESGSVSAMRRKELSGTQRGKYGLRGILQWKNHVGFVLGQSLTPRSSSPSSRCRGTMVIISISHRNATSEGVRPAGRGSAMRIEWDGRRG